MAKYIHKFETQAEFQAAYTSDAYVEPWLSCVVENNGVSYNKIMPSEAGDIVYYNNGTLKFRKSANWDSGLGTPVAIVVVPSGHTPDGTVRCIAITGVNRDGSQATSNITTMGWAQNSTNTPLPNLSQVPRWDNTIGGTIGSYSFALLSSNNNNGQFTGATDCLDSNLHYVDTSQYLPNPYLPDGSPNPDFRNTSIVTDNACADFDGSGNTAVLVGLGTAYTAANACHKYNTKGINAGNWYLPACGELAYIIPRFNEIQNALSAVGGVQLRAYDDYWSSSEYKSGYAWEVSTNRGMVDGRSKTHASYVRCFCSLPGNLGF